MPCKNKSIQMLCVNTALLFSLLAITGHFSINFWERYAVQNRLIIMKRNLSSLKATVSQIEKIYDNLDNDLSELSDKVDGKPPAAITYKVKNEVSQLKTNIKTPKEVVGITRLPIQLTNDNTNKSLSRYDKYKSIMGF